MIIFDTKSNDNHNETKITEITITTRAITITTRAITITTAAVISRITETATTTTEIFNRGNEII